MEYHNFEFEGFERDKKKYRRLYNSLTIKCKLECYISFNHFYGNFHGGSLVNLCYYLIAKF